MDIKITSTYNFADYSKFEKTWVFVVLCKEILPRKDMLYILKHFNMRFFGDDWENKISLEEIGNVMFGDIEKNELITYINQYLKNQYPKLFSFEETEKIYNTLLQINDIVEIMKMWLSFGNSKDKPDLRNYVEEGLNRFEKLTLKERFVNEEEKNANSGYFIICLEEILVSLYKLAMKNN